MTVVLAKCEWCGADFEKRHPAKQFCSRKCKCAHYDQANLDRIRERQRQYRIDHAEELRTKRREYYLANAERLRRQSKKWAAANAERRRERNAHWHTENRDSVRERASVWHRDHQDLTRQRNAEWYRTHPEVSRSKARRRRAIKRQATAEPYKSTDIYERDSWMCQLCGQRVNRRIKYPHPRSASIDHIVPLGPDGPDTPANVQLAHLACNSAKQARTLPAGEQLRFIG